MLCIDKSVYMAPCTLSRNFLWARTKRYPKAGFTLIEMSIVLVIIGLIVGGILVGQDLIYAATLRKAAVSIEKYNTAVHTFRTKYNCLPGDCTNATQFFGTTDPDSNTIYNGNGDGIINLSTGDYAFQNVEAWMFWHHLYLGNLISFKISIAGTVLTIQGGSERCGVNYPCFFEDRKQTNLLLAAADDNTAQHNNILPNYYMLTSDYISDNPTFFGGGSGAFGLQGVYAPISSYQPGLNPMDAYNIDKKIDDGSPLSGSMQAVFPSNYKYCVPATPNNNQCVSTATGNPYSINNANSKTRSCWIRILAPF